MRTLLACLAFATICMAGVTSALATPVNVFDQVNNPPASMCDQATTAGVGLASISEAVDVCMLPTEKVAFAGPPKSERQQFYILMVNGCLCSFVDVDATRLPQTIPK